MPPYMLRPYMFKQVAHWKSGRQGLVINWYDDGWKARKMWILFEDGEVELRWIDAFVDDDSMATRDAMDTRVARIIDGHKGSKGGGRKGGPRGS